jgi:hypothetical protein
LVLSLLPVRSRTGTELSKRRIGAKAFWLISLRHQHCGDTRGLPKAKEGLLGDLVEIVHQFRDLLPGAPRAGLFGLLLKRNPSTQSGKWYGML